MNNKNTRCGLIAFVGRPNVGKSTLMNQLVGEKISIITAKPQTTRHRILGILTDENDQLIFFDTPGIHGGVKRLLNKQMNRVALSVLSEVDMIVFIVDSLAWREDDDLVLKALKNISRPVILVINKIDKIKERGKLLPQIEKLTQRYSFAAVVPLSAMNGENVNALLGEMKQRLLIGPHLYEKDQLTDIGERFWLAEIIREKLMRVLGEELPYSLTVGIEQVSEEPLQKREGILKRIHAIIWVEKPGQKAIVIGKHGAMLKKVGQQARIEMENYLEQKVFLQLWVKVKKGWSDDERALKSLGYF